VERAAVFYAIRRKAESTRLAGLEIVEHTPDSIQFTSLHHLQRRKAVEGGVGLRKPAADLGRLDHAGETVEQPIHFNQGFFLFGRRRFALAPLGHRAGREAGEADQLRLGDMELGTVSFEQAGVVSRATVPKTDI